MTISVSHHPFFCPWHNGYNCPNTSNLTAIVLVVLECEVLFPHIWILIKSLIQVRLLNTYQFLATQITPILRWIKT